MGSDVPTMSLLSAAFPLLLFVQKVLLFSVRVRLAQCRVQDLLPRRQTNLSLTLAALCFLLG